MGWVRALEDTIDVTGGLLPEIEMVDPIGDQTAARHKKAVRVDRWQSEPRGKTNDQFVMNRSSPDWSARSDPPFGSRANADSPRSIVTASRTSNAFNSTRKTMWPLVLRPTMPVPPGVAGSRSTPTGVTRGAICLRISSHFAPMPKSRLTKSGYVATRIRKAVHKAAINRIHDLRKHDRNCLGPLHLRQSPR